MATVSELLATPSGEETETDDEAMAEHGAMPSGAATGSANARPARKTDALASDGENPNESEIGPSLESANATSDALGPCGHVNASATGHEGHGKTIRNGST